MGASTRKGYSVLGESVNYASRLMNFSRNGIPCIDKYTQRAVSKFFTTIQIDNVHLKGMDKEQSVYELIDEIEDSTSFDSEEVLVGRKHELSWLMARQEESVLKGVTGVLVAEAGVGKSRLAYEFYKQALSKNVEILQGACFSYEKFNPYYAWKSIFIQLFGIRPGETDDEKISKIDIVIKNFDDISQEWVKVFSNIIGISVEEDSFTATLDPKQKNERILQITKELIADRALHKQILIVIEDFHWVDDASEALMMFLMKQNIKQVFLLLIARPGLPAEAFSDAGCQKLDLQNFSEGEAREYLRLKLNLEATNVKVEDVILNRALGNPFFIESIVYSMKEQGFLKENENGSNEITGKIENLAIPNSLQDVLLMRIDKLDGEEQTILKAAAVVGRLFDLNVLKALVPVSIHAELSRVLNVLQSNDFTLLETEDPVTYFFRHILIREVAYNSILSSVKHDLHLRLAHHLEGEYKDHLKEAADTLSHHFLEGKNTEKAVFYCKLAAEKALERYGNKDAIHYYDQILDIYKDDDFGVDHPEVLNIKGKQALAYARANQYDTAIAQYNEVLIYLKDPIERATIYSGLGQVYQELGESRVAIQNLETASSILGKNVPKSKIGVFLGIGKNLALNEINEKFSFLISKGIKNEEKKRILIQRMNILNSLEKIYYFLDVEKMAWANLEFVMLAIKSQNPGYMSKAYANFGILMSALAFTRRADVYYDRGIKYAGISNDPELEAIAYSRSATKGFYGDDPVQWHSNIQLAVEKFQEVSNQWELLISIVQIAISNFFMSNFQKTIDAYSDLAKKAEIAGQLHYIAWAQMTIPFCEYLLGQKEGSKAIDEVARAYAIVKAANDMPAVLTSLFHLTLMAKMEKDADLCILYAQETYKYGLAYTNFIPDAHSSLASAAEAAIYAMSVGAGSKSELDKIAKKCSKKLITYGKSYPTVKGLSQKAWARYQYHSGNKNGARKTILETIEFYEKGVNRWQTGLAYREAAEMFEDLRDAYLEKANSIFQEKNIMAEIKLVNDMKISG
jgi:tetratricopeptide (TPR) repeat protein